MTGITPHDDIDPLDVQDSRLRAAQRFWSNLAAALLLEWLLTDVEKKQPSYFSDLESRFESGYEYARMWKEDGTFDGNVPIHTADETDVEFWIGLDELDLLHQQLFPHGSHDAPTFADGRALVVLVLQSALETLFQDLKLQKGGDESTIAAVLRLLGLGATDPTYAALIELRETRNLYAHHGGAVTERYVRIVKDSSFVVGEKRIVALEDLSRFAASVRQAGQRLIALA